MLFKFFHNLVMWLQLVLSVTTQGNLNRFREHLFILTNGNFVVEWWMDTLKIVLLIFFVFFRGRIYCATSSVIRSLLWPNFSPGSSWWLEVSKRGSSSEWNPNISKDSTSWQLSKSKELFLSTCESPLGPGWSHLRRRLWTGCILSHLRAAQQHH